MEHQELKYLKLCDKALESACAIFLFKFQTPPTHIWVSKLDIFEIEGLETSTPDMTGYVGSLDGLKIYKSSLKKAQHDFSLHTIALGLKFSLLPKSIVQQVIDKMTVNDLLILSNIQNGHVKLVRPNGTQDFESNNGIDENLSKVLTVLDIETKVETSAWLKFKRKYLK